MSSVGLCVLFLLLQAGPLSAPKRPPNIVGIREQGSKIVVSVLLPNSSMTRAKTWTLRVNGREVSKDKIGTRSPYREFAVANTNQELLFVLLLSDIDGGIVSSAEQLYRRPTATAAINWDVVLGGILTLVGSFGSLWLQDRLKKRAARLSVMSRLRSDLKRAMHSLEVDAMSDPVFEKFRSGTFERVYVSRSELAADDILNEMRRLREYLQAPDIGISIDDVRGCIQRLLKMLSR